MKKIIAIVGPTATGKSNLAVKLAKKFSGEIISADSRAIYKHLSIGTAKVPGKWENSTPPQPTSHKGRENGRSGNVKSTSFIYKNVKHYLIDFLEPAKTFSAYEFAGRAQKLINSIDLPIVVGGTGFWIEALFKPALLGPAGPNLKLRKQLAKKSTAQLYSRLKKLDPKRARTIQKTNKRRLIRALEIALNPSPLQATTYQPPASPAGGQADLDVLWIGLNLPNPKLKEKIRERFLLWLKQGLIKEAKWLTKKVSKKRLKEIGLAYLIIAEYLAVKISKEQMIERSVNSIHHYAKRQKTWFKRNKNIHWVKNEKQAVKLVKKFLS